MAGVVDTSALFALLDPDDEHHARARRALEQHLGLEVPPVVLAETAGLLAKRKGRPVSIRALPELLRANPHIGVLDADLHPSADSIWRRHGGISYADAHAIAAALLLDDDLITFDERQETVWRKERRRG